MFPLPSRAQARTCQPGTKDLKAPSAQPGPVPPGGRHRGVLGESNRKIPTASGCEEEEGDSRYGERRPCLAQAESLSHQLSGTPVSLLQETQSLPGGVELFSCLNLEVFYCSYFADGLSKIQYMYSVIHFLLIKNNLTGSGGAHL